jgi:hypothetical protein
MCASQPGQHAVRRITIQRQCTVLRGQLLQGRGPTAYQYQLHTISGQQCSASCPNATAGTGYHHGFTLFAHLLSFLKRADECTV